LARRVHSMSCAAVALLKIEFAWPPGSGRTPFHEYRECFNSELAAFAAI
jgi:hypothetical protein